MTATITRTDEQIQREVLAELEWDATVRSTEIGVAVKDGVITLTGWVDSYAKKLAAERAAHRVRGVKAVAMKSRCACLVLPNAPTLTSPWR